MTSHRLRPPRVLLRAIAIASVAGALIAGTSSAYIGQNPYLVTRRASAENVSCGGQITVFATFAYSKTSAPAPFLQADWFLDDARPGDRLSASRTRTNTAGETSVTLTFGSTPGERTVRFYANKEFQENVGVSCSGPSGGGRPGDPGDPGIPGDPGDGEPSGPGSGKPGGSGSGGGDVAGPSDGDSNAGSDPETRGSSDGGTTDGGTTDGDSSTGGSPDDGGTLPETSTLSELMGSDGPRMPAPAFTLLLVIILAGAISPLLLRKTG